MEGNEDMNCPLLRISECEVCSKNKAKYTCPRCELRTCCLECLKIHKKELECSGLRDKVKFKMLKGFDNIDLLNDYRLLEETARLVNRSGNLPPTSCYNPINGGLPSDLYRLKCTASARGIQLHFLPPSFSRHCSNTSFLDHENQDLYWRVDWVFPQAGNLTFTDEKILDSSLLSTCLHKYIHPEEKTQHALSFYEAAGHPGTKLLLKAERVAPNRYYMLDPNTSLRENLNGKSIVEYPEIYVVLTDHIYVYNVISDEEEMALRKRQRRRHFVKKRARKSYNNFLFPNSNDAEDIESNEEMSGTEDTSNIDDDDNDKPYNQHRNVFHHRGGRGYFKNNWNPKRGRGFSRGRRFHRRNGNKFFENAVNGGLSNNFSSVNINSQ